MSAANESKEEIEASPSEPTNEGSSKKVMRLSQVKKLTVKVSRVMMTLWLYSFR